MASVHLGRLVGPVGFSRTVAIKQLHPQLARDPDGVSAFLDEARLTARVQHPNVAQTLDVVELPGELFLVMEYVRGETLSRLVRAVVAKGERPPIRVATSIVTDALYGLHAAHEARSERGVPLGIVHRDVSPQNLIVGVDGVARVLDFGVAKAVGRVTTTSDGQVKGKLAYMPPEQISTGQVDRRSDVYAAAVVLWETLTARRLFAADTQGVVIGRILRGEIESPKKYVPELSSELEAIVMRGLALDPNARFATAQDMATELERAAAASPREVGAWVESIAGAVLAERATLVAEIESASFTAAAIEALRESASSPREVPPPARPAIQSDEPTRTDSSLSAVATSPPSLLPTTPLGEAPAPPRRRPRIVVLAAITTALVIAIAVVALRGGGSTAPTGATASSEPPPSATESATELASSSPPPASSVATPTASIVASARTPSSRPTTRGGAKPVVRDCNPPYRVDADGIRHMKPECF